MARLAGFEPTTPWFVARYSIQLSYSRAKEPDSIMGFELRLALMLLTLFS
jgi:hypothetical protein